MCLIAWNWDPTGETPLLLLANRDEYYARPTLPLHWWVDAHILAGRDLQGGGTWLGVGGNGRLAALTNFRLPALARTGTPSRGGLITEFLQENTNAPTYLEKLATRANDYNPFNLLVFDGQTLCGFESHSGKIIDFPHGISAVSNASFHTPWPKLMRLENGLRACLNHQRADTGELMELLGDRNIAADLQLPKTGIPLALERALSAVFIATATYGTRASSVIRWGHNQVQFSEFCFDANGRTQQQHYDFSL